MCISFFLENEINGNNNNDASSSSAGGFSIVPIAAAAGGGIVILIVVLIVVIRRRRQPTNPSRQRSVVAFENPTYAEPAFSQNVEKANPLYAWAEKDDRAEEKTDNTDYNTVVSALGHHAADGGMYDEAAPYQPNAAQGLKLGSDLLEDDWNEEQYDAGYLDVTAHPQMEDGLGVSTGDQYFEPDADTPAVEEVQPIELGGEYLESEPSSAFKVIDDDDEVEKAQGEEVNNQVDSPNANDAAPMSVDAELAEHDATSSEQQANDFGFEDASGANPAGEVSDENLTGVSKPSDAVPEDETIEMDQVKHEAELATDVAQDPDAQEATNDE